MSKCNSCNKISNIAVAQGAIPLGKRVIIIGGGFAGLAVGKRLGSFPGLDVTLLDRRNHHLFQPLLYQVSMAGLSPADIASPIRSIFRRHPNVRVMLGAAESIDVVAKNVRTDFGNLPYDYLIVATGATHSYFGHQQWEEHAPGLKNIEQATEIRRRVFQAFELAERETDPQAQRRLLTLVVIGGGPTGVELAGALGEITRFTLAKDFRTIDPGNARVILIEAGDRILPGFDLRLSHHAKRDLEKLGVQIWLSSRVTNVTADGVTVGAEFLKSSCVLWAAGVRASALTGTMGLPLDNAGRVIIDETLSPVGHPEIFVLGDCAALRDEKSSQWLPGLAPVAMQQGRHCARQILADLSGQQRKPFRYVDKGMMATIGRSRAVLQFGRLRMVGWPAWMAWLLVHIWYLVGFRNKVLVYIQWIWSFLRYKRGARLIIDKSWKLKP